MILVLRAKMQMYRERYLAEHALVKQFSTKLDVSVNK